MFRIAVEGHFSSAHNLREYKGKCEELHGHNWKVRVCVDNDRLDKAGMVMDFKKLKKQLNNILEELDHKYLNRLKAFKIINPTSENIASYIYGKLKPKIAALQSVTVWENSSSSATYEE